MSRTIWSLALDTVTQQNFPYIDRIVQHALENGSTPGAALLVKKRDDLLYRRAVGFAQIYPEHKPLHEETVFDLASLTKVIATTTAIMCLVRDRHARLSDSVTRFIPDFPHQQMTLLHLLTHSAGYPDWRPFFEDVQAEADRRGAAFIGSPEAKQLVINTICQTPLLAPPGQAVRYSDLGFLLLGHLIEVISGMSLDRYCEEAIFRPFGMTSTFFHPAGQPLRDDDYAATERCEWRRRIMYGEVHDENAYAIGGVAGHAGLFSTIDDIACFMSRLHHCYTGADESIPPAIVREFFTRQPLGPSSTRAIGWDTPSHKKSTAGTLISETSVGHTGFTGTSIWLDLKRQLFILLFSNRVHPSRHNQTFLRMRPKIHDTVIIATERDSL